jgi:hypothetical protein
MLKKITTLKKPPPQKRKVLTMALITMTRVTKKRPRLMERWIPWRKL